MVLTIIVAVLMTVALLWYVFYVLLPNLSKNKSQKEQKVGHGDLDALIAESAHLAQNKQVVKSKLKLTKQALEEAEKQVEN